MRDLDFLFRFCLNGKAGDACGDFAEIVEIPAVAGRDGDGGKLILYRDRLGGAERQPATRCFGGNGVHSVVIVVVGMRPV